MPRHDGFVTPPTRADSPHLTSPLPTPTPFTCTRWPGYRAFASKGLGDRRGKGGARLTIELSSSPTHSEPLPVRGLGDDVKVDVEDGLVGPRAVVLEHIELGGSGRREDGAGDPGQDASHGRRGVVAEPVEGRRGFLGDHQGVPRAQWEDVKEGKDMGILIDLVTGNLASDDLGENGLSHAPSVATAKRGQRTQDRAE